MTAVGASMFGHPVWPQAYNDFVHAADHATWVCEPMTEVDYDLVGVPEGGPAANFVRDGLAGKEGSWKRYAIPDVQRDNVLAMLMLLHVHVRCVVEPFDGDDDDIVEEVSSASTHVALSSSGAAS